ncbi:hypothetical protein RCL1_000706 [Eukaryota sp. TZLM3-RCL]
MEINELSKIWSKKLSTIWRFYSLVLSLNVQLQFSIIVQKSKSRLISSEIDLSEIISVQNELNSLILSVPLMIKDALSVITHLPTTFDPYSVASTSPQSINLIVSSVQSRLSYLVKFMSYPDDVTLEILDPNILNSFYTEFSLYKSQLELSINDLISKGHEKSVEFQQTFIEIEKIAERRRQLAVERTQNFETSKILVKEIENLSGEIFDWCQGFVDNTIKLGQNGDVNVDSISYDSLNSFSSVLSSLQHHSSKFASNISEISDLSHQINELQTTSFFDFTKITFESVIQMLETVQSMISPITIVENDCKKLLVVAEGLQNELSEEGENFDLKISHLIEKSNILLNSFSSAISLFPSLPPFDCKRVFDLLSTNFDRLVSLISITYSNNSSQLFKSKSEPAVKLLLNQLIKRLSTNSRNSLGLSSSFSSLHASYAKSLTNLSFLNIVNKFLTVDLKNDSEVIKYTDSIIATNQKLFDRLNHFYTISSVVTTKYVYHQNIAIITHSIINQINSELSDLFSSPVYHWSISVEQYSELINWVKCLISLFKGSVFQFKKEIPKKISGILVNDLENIIELEHEINQIDGNLSTFEGLLTTIGECQNDLSINLSKYLTSCSSLLSSSSCSPFSFEFETFSPFPSHPLNSLMYTMTTQFESLYRVISNNSKQQEVFTTNSLAKNLIKILKSVLDYLVDEYSKYDDVISCLFRYDFDLDSMVLIKPASPSDYLLRKLILRLFGSDLSNSSNLTASLESIISDCFSVYNVLNDQNIASKYLEDLKVINEYFVNLSTVMKSFQDKLSLLSSGSKLDQNSVDFGRLSQTFLNIISLPNLKVINSIVELIPCSSENLFNNSKILDFLNCLETLLISFSQQISSHSSLLSSTFYFSNLVNYSHCSSELALLLGKIATRRNFFDELERNKRVQDKTITNLCALIEKVFQSLVFSANLITKMKPKSCSNHCVWTDDVSLCCHCLTSLDQSFFTIHRKYLSELIEFLDILELSKRDFISFKNRLINNTHLSTLSEILAIISAESYTFIEDFVTKMHRLVPHVKSRWSKYKEVVANSCKIIENISKWCDKVSKSTREQVNILSKINQSLETVAIGNLIDVFDCLIALDSSKIGDNFPEQEILNILRLVNSNQLPNFDVKFSLISFPAVVQKLKLVRMELYSAIYLNTIPTIQEVLFSTNSELSASSCLRGTYLELIINNCLIEKNNRNSRRLFISSDSEFKPLDNYSVLLSKKSCDLNLIKTQSNSEITELKEKEKRVKILYRSLYESLDEFFMLLTNVCSHDEISEEKIEELSFISTKFNQFEGQFSRHQIKIPDICALNCTLSEISSSISSYFEFTQSRQLSNVNENNLLSTENLANLIFLFSSVNLSFDHSSLSKVNDFLSNHNFLTLIFESSGTDSYAIEVGKISSTICSIISGLSESNQKLSDNNTKILMENISTSFSQDVTEISDLIISDLNNSGDVLIPNIFKLLTVDFCSKLGSIIDLKPIILMERIKIGEYLSHLFDPVISFLNINPKKSIFKFVTDLSFENSNNLEDLESNILDEISVLNYSSELFGFFIRQYSSLFSIFDLGDDQRLSKVKESQVSILSAQSGIQYLKNFTKNSEYSSTNSQLFTLILDLHSSLASSLESLHYSGLSKSSAKVLLAGVPNLLTNSRKFTDDVNISGQFFVVPGNFAQDCVAFSQKLIDSTNILLKCIEISQIFSLSIHSPVTESSVSQLISEHQSFLIENFDRLGSIVNNVTSFISSQSISEILNNSIEKISSLHHSKLKRFNIFVEKLNGLISTQSNVELDCLANQSKEIALIRNTLDAWNFDLISYCDENSKLFDLLQSNFSLKCLDEFSNNFENLESNFGSFVVVQLNNHFKPSVFDGHHLFFSDFLSIISNSSFNQILIVVFEPIISESVKEMQGFIENQKESNQKLSTFDLSSSVAMDNHNVDFHLFGHNQSIVQRISLLIEPLRALLSTDIQSDLKIIDQSIENDVIQLKKMQSLVSDFCNTMVDFSRAFWSGKFHWTFNQTAINQIDTSSIEILTQKFGVFNMNVFKNFQNGFNSVLNDSVELVNNFQSNLIDQSFLISESLNALNELQSNVLEKLQDHDVIQSISFSEFQSDLITIQGIFSETLADAVPNCFVCKNLVENFKTIQSLSCFILDSLLSNHLEANNSKYLSSAELKQSNLIENIGTKFSTLEAQTKAFIKVLKNVDFDGLTQSTTSTVNNDLIDFVDDYLLFISPLFEFKHTAVLSNSRINSKMIDNLIDDVMSIKSPTDISKMVSDHLVGFVGNFIEISTNKGLNSIISGFLTQCDCFSAAVILDQSNNLIDLDFSQTISERISTEFSDLHNQIQSRKLQLSKEVVLSLLEVMTSSLDQNDLIFDFFQSKSWIVSRGFSEPSELSCLLNELNLQSIQVKKLKTQLEDVDLISFRLDSDCLDVFDSIESSISDRSILINDTFNQSTNKHLDYGCPIYLAHALENLIKYTRDFNSAFEIVTGISAEVEIISFSHFISLLTDTGLLFVNGPEDLLVALKRFLKHSNQPRLISSGLSCIVSLACGGDVAKRATLIAPKRSDDTIDIVGLVSVIFQ